MMSSSCFYKFILVFGFLSLFHSAYSAAQHRSYLRINEKTFTILPVDIILQAVCSLFVIMYAVLQIAGDFKEIKASAELEDKSWETFGNIPAFYQFNHRGKTLSPSHAPSISSKISEDQDV